jgi:outer membrane immunogenic protein
MGYGWNNDDTHITPLPTAAIFVNLAPQTQSPGSKGLLGGMQVGYNKQLDILVFGLETDFSFSGSKGSRTVSPIIQNDGTTLTGPGGVPAGQITVHEDTDWVGTVRLRAGATPVPKLLIYLTGGLAYGRVNYSANTDFRPGGGGTEQYKESLSTIKVGYAVGTGSEVAINKHWSVKAEYLFYDLGDKSVIASPSIPFGSGAPDFKVKYRWETSAHTVNLGFNYRF